MFAFSPDRHATPLHSSASNDASRRFVRPGGTPPSAQPLTHPHSAPALPFSAPSEPVHERAYPQADGEP